MSPKKQPKLKEIAPGEIRTVCWVCETPVGKRALYCDEHRDHKQNACEKCGKGTRGTICCQCRKGQKPSVAIREGGKRILTELDRPLVEKWWAEGVKSPEIAQRLGLVTTKAATVLGQWRKQGWNLPYRKPELIEPMRKLGERRKIAA